MGSGLSKLSKLWRDYSGLRVRGSGVRVQGSGFRKATVAGTRVLGILPHGRLGPAAIGRRQLRLQFRPRTMFIPFFPEPRTLNPNHLSSYLKQSVSRDIPPGDAAGCPHRNRAVCRRSPRPRPGTLPLPIVVVPSGRRAASRDPAGRVGAAGTEIRRPVQGRVRRHPGPDGPAGKSAAEHRVQCGGGATPLGNTPAGAHQTRPARGRRLAAVSSVWCPRNSTTVVYLTHRTVLKRRRRAVPVS